MSPIYQDNLLCQSWSSAPCAPLRVSVVDADSARSRLQAGDRARSGRTSCPILLFAYDASLRGWTSADSADRTLFDVQQRFFPCCAAVPDAWCGCDTRIDEHAGGCHAFLRCSTPPWLEIRRHTRLRLRGWMRKPAATLGTLRSGHAHGGGGHLHIGASK